MAEDETVEFCHCEDSDVMLDDEAISVYQELRDRRASFRFARDNK
ncbi:hypothetical protein [Candidatus Oleimmundimicrobium sp.]|nr:hypothetical protein [Candidatus Oleimmundimicrobium sp.]